MTRTNTSLDGIEIGDLVLVTGDWTPEGKNAGYVKGLDVAGWLRKDGHVLVDFGTAGEFVYLPSSLTVVRP